MAMDHFFLTKICSLYHLQDFCRPQVTRYMSYKKQEHFSFHKHLGSPRFLSRSVLLIFLISVLYFFVSVRCLMSSVVRVSGLSIFDSPFGFL
jgi:uncharacterized membrane protein required for colicin V production